MAIGTHDLDTLTPPFVYEALPPKDINFVPLNQTESQDAVKMFENFEHDAKIKKFLPIIRDSPVYPLISDLRPYSYERPYRDSPMNSLSS